jgi:hypothetical protein
MKRVTSQAAVLLVLTIILFSACTEKRSVQTLNTKSASREIKLPPLLADVAPNYPEAIVEVSRQLRSEGADPKEFRAEIEELNGTELIFRLWHQSAFLPEHQNSSGNPGGKCRDIVYDLKSGKASKSQFWQ